MRIRRAYLAGQLAFRKGLGYEPPGHYVEEWLAEFKRGWADERRRTLHNAGKRRVEQR